MTCEHREICDGDNDALFCEGPVSAKPWCFKIKTGAKKPHTVLSNSTDGLSDKCACCGKEIMANHVRLGAGEHSICMGCEGAEIDVWKVELVC